MEILNFGSLNIDRTYEVDAFVQSGMTVASKNHQELIGGKGLNQSIALKRAQATVHHIGAIGTDGGILKEALITNNIPTDYLLELDTHSGHAVIQIDATGNNCILVEGGANFLVTKDHIDVVFDRFKGQEYLVLLQNEISNVDYIIERAKEEGHHVVLNPSPMNTELLSAPLEQVDCFILNETEGNGLTGKNDPDEILDELHEKFPDAVFILTLGDKGSIYFDGKQKVEQEAYLTPVVDTTGAGDTFTGFVLASLLAGDSIKDSLDKASIASSLSIGVKGAVNSIPSLEEVYNKYMEEEKNV